MYLLLCLFGFGAIGVLVAWHADEALRDQRAKALFYRLGPYWRAATGAASKALLVMLAVGALYLIGTLFGALQAGGFLKQSTAATRPVGPMVDTATAATPYTAVIPATCVWVYKNGAAPVTKHDASTSVYGGRGTHLFTFDGTDTDTRGHFRAEVYVSGKLLAWIEGMVITQQFYDSMHSDDKLQVDVMLELGTQPATSASGVRIVKAATSLGARVTHWGATAIPATYTAGYPIVTVKDGTGTGEIDTSSGHVVKVLTSAGASIDAILVDTGTTLPALLGGIGTAGGAAISTDVNDDNYDGGIAGVTVGTTKDGTETNTYTATSVLDGTAHIMTHAAQDVDIVYQFLGGGGTSPVSIVWTGLINPINDTLTISAWNHGATHAGPGWEVIGTQAGQVSATAFVVRNIVIYARHMGTSAAELGKVYLRLNSAAAYNHVLRTDQVYMAYSVTARTVGYAGGAVWVDTVNGTAGTESYVNGTADNASKTLADALTIAGNIGVERLEFVNGSSVTLTANTDNWTLCGHEWTLALGGVSIANAHVSEATVTGVSTGTGAHFKDCQIDTSTFADGSFTRCGFVSGATVTFSGATTYRFIGCHTEGPAPAPIFDFGAAVANTTAMFSNWSGGLQIVNHGANGTDKSSFHGRGSVTIAATSVAGTLGFHGFWTITDNVVGGFVTGGGVINEEARYDQGRIDDFVWTDPATRILTALDEDTTTIDLDGTTVGGLTTWDKTGYSIADATSDAVIADAVWNAATASYGVAGSYGLLIETNVNATIASRSSHTAANVWAVAARTLTAATNITSTGGTTFTQTGDSFARLGAPAAASVSADIWGISGTVNSILLDTSATLPTTLAGLATSAALATVDANVDAVLADTAELQGNQGAWATAVGFSTHSAADTATALKASTGWEVGNTLSFATVTRRTYAQAWCKMTHVGGTATIYDSDGTTVLGTFTSSDTAWTPD